MNAKYIKYILDFKRPSGTSRGVLVQKETWFIELWDEQNYGIGECGILRGLSIDDRFDYEEKLKWVCNNINLGLTSLLEELIEFPSIQFGLEMAFLSLKGEDEFLLHPSKFTSGLSSIPINGLIWMGDKRFMRDQIRNKIKDGFNCIKLKIGTINFQEEFSLLESIRDEFSSKDIELRVDANGAFHTKNALEKLKQLSKLDLHSIEQPIGKNQHGEMAMLCEKSPLAIALDEELIGVFDVKKRQKLLQMIHPEYIILKPSLIGGYKNSSHWINLAEEMDIGWWVTSALESNIGLNAIAQWTNTLKNDMPQGLGTGSLFTNNFESPLIVEKGELHYKPNKKWNVNI